MFSNLSLGFLGGGIVGCLTVLQQLLLPKAPWFSEFSISVATWCSCNCTPVKSCYFETALLHSPFNSLHSRQAIVTSVNINPFFPTINGFLDSIIPMRVCLILLNMKFKMFSFINYPVLQHFFLRCWWKYITQSHLTCSTATYEPKGAWWACALCVCTGSGAPLCGTDRHWQVW